MYGLKPVSSKYSGPRQGTKSGKKALLGVKKRGKKLFSSLELVCSAHILTEWIVALDAVHCVSVPDESIVELVGVWRIRRIPGKLNGRII